ncbi:MAG: toxin-antitoxin system YwqK family antitoxin [Bacteroidia bacterium]
MKTKLIIIAFVVSGCLSLHAINRNYYTRAEGNKYILQDDQAKREYYRNGVLKSEIPYSEGRKNGIAKEYYENGSIKSETPYEDGVKNGIVREYDENGELISENTFTDGVQGQKTIMKRRK